MGANPKEKKGESKTMLSENDLLSQELFNSDAIIQEYLTGLQALIRQINQDLQTVKEQIAKRRQTYVAFDIRNAKEQQPHLKFPPLLDHVTCVIATTMHAPISALKSKSRSEHIAHCRQVAMYLCRKLSDGLISWTLIGEYLKRDHTTVMHGYGVIARRILADEAFRRRIKVLETEIINLMQERAKAAA